MTTFIGNGRRQRPSKMDRFVRFTRLEPRLRPAAKQQGPEASAASDVDDDVLTPEEVRRRFRWRTREGESLALASMATSHVFNAMKMCFNHMTRLYPSLRPVLFTHHYSTVFHSENEPQRMAWHVIFFILEIDRRGDLPTQHIVPYSIIRSQVISIAGGQLPALPPLSGYVLSDGGE